MKRIAIAIRSLWSGLLGLFGFQPAQKPQYRPLVELKDRRVFYETSRGPGYEHIGEIVGLVGFGRAVLQLSHLPEGVLVKRSVDRLKPISVLVVNAIPDSRLFA